MAGGESKSIVETTENGIRNFLRKSRIEVLRIFARSDSDKSITDGNRDCLGACVRIQLREDVSDM